ncbi:hypothetical protein Lgra_1602 [Legionella gratiana]|uniref:Uncharacterized protein n=1 Tax=Legionella gratiana TaxID=45066 RepID=A0A378J885_9GAMM|nr:hypothetical protein [Legionella gratiana]KTD10636.1 hypothetical protein Lgra_1602 [Legionella gratiana]STX43586.1 Uncharacterised protein [Legionella gratiana]
MKIHYIFDVDDTFMVNVSGNLIFNQSIIDWLKKNDIKSISLLTRMDAKNLSITSPIRVELINYLNQNGIKVERVYTPLDLLFRSINPNLPLGGAYESYMFPVEVAVMSIKQIDEKIFNSCAIAHGKYNEIEAMKFLLTQGILNPKEKLIEINEEKKKKIMGEVDNYFNEQYQNGYKHQNGVVDFDVIHELFIHFKLAAQKNPNIEFQELLNQYEQDYQERQQAIPQLEPKQQSALDNYFNVLKKYRNLNYHAHLIKNRVQADDCEFSKGQVYETLVTESAIGSQDVVFFVDDSKREHASLIEAHKNNNFKHRLLYSFPPLSMEFNQETCVSMDNFESIITLQKLRVDLGTHINGTDPLSVNKLKSCVALLNNYGIELQNKGQHQIAANYFKAAFMFSPATDDFAFIRESIINNYLINYDYLNKNAVPDNADEDNLLITSILSDINNQPSFATKIKGVEFELALHRKQHPFFYAESQSRFQLRQVFFNKFTSVQVDEAFEQKIINKLRMIHEEHSEEARMFIKELENKILPQAFKTSLESLLQRADANNHPIDYTSSG